MNVGQTAAKGEGLTRRSVLKGAAAVMATVSIVPRHVLGAPGKKTPSETPVVAGVGIGGVGHGQIQQCDAAGFHVGVLCDIDDVYAERTYKKYPQARRYRDFREMLSAEGDKIDAVYCGTPDHTHAIISMAALKAKKHVLTVKPLTRTIGEGRMLAEEATRAGVMTQMTAAPASTENGCRTCEILWDGIIGDVTEVHIWSNRPLWPHGMNRPPGSDPVPDTFDWDLWLGPAAKRPWVAEWPAESLALEQVNRFKPRPAVYHPWNFRGWYDFGTGALGDMGCHHWNIPRRALKLGHATAVSASSTKIMDESWPLASIITYEFPARDSMPPVKIVWYDGGLRPPRPVELDATRPLPRDGIIYMGTKGAMMGSGSSGIPRLLPESKMKAYKQPPTTLPRRSGIYGEWFEAVTGGEKPSEHWPDCAVPLSELVLLGCVAVRAGGYLKWDGPKMRFTNSDDANKLVKPDYQNGWSLVCQALYDEHDDLCIDSLWRRDPCSCHMSSNQDARREKEDLMPQFTCTAALPLVILGLLGGATHAQPRQPDIVFEEDFADPTLPAWRGARVPPGRLSPTEGPDGIPALSIETHQPGSTTLSVRLPVERIAGRAVLLDVWRKAENVKTGARHYFNAKSMLSWKAEGVANPQYSGTHFSDFSGTFDWERHRYVIKMPKDLQWASVSIGMQACTGKAAWAGLTVSVDPRFPDQASLERFLAREERQAFAELDAETLTVKRMEGGIIQVLAGTRYVPRKYWNGTVRRAVLTAVPEPAVDSHRSDAAFSSQLAVALQARAKQLKAGLEGLTGQSLNDRLFEIASLRERVRQIRTNAIGNGPIRLKADSAAQFPVSPFVFGNNINTQNLSAPYDTTRSRFQEEFLKRVRPMGITFLRYPGGCNADVFNWKDTIGPVDQRKDIINYHNGTSRGIARFGVDEYLRFCEQESMTPIITTAFCKDHPGNVDPNDHPNGIRHPYVVSYLKTAPERVQLAADWVEYCNGSVDTPHGKLRAQNGHREPYNVKYWEIGNESYGPDPTGSCTAQEYAKAFPAYVRAMKARDPSITIVMNGHSDVDWSDTVLRLAGRHADAFQFHIYHTPRFHSDDAKLEGRPHLFTDATRSTDRIPGLLQEIEALMQKHVGRTLPTIISEFGMGNARDRELMTSVTSPVLVADMWRTLIESPMIHGANKWCLFTGHWFSQIQGPTIAQPDAPYYNRPEHTMHAIYARCRGKTRLAVNNEQSEGVKAVVFQRPGSYGVILISREAVTWQSITLDLPDARRDRATCLLMTAGHPLLGNEHDHALVRPYEFKFDYAPEQPILVPSNSVIGLIVPR